MDEKANAPSDELREAATTLRAAVALSNSIALAPGVALAVADWLDEVAADSHASLPHWVETAALKVARAYMGKDRTDG